MVVTRRSVDRRMFLRGTGAAFALPLLDAMTPAFAVDRVRPTRLGFVQVPNGIMNLQNQFAPKDVGALSGDLPPILRPLTDFRDRLLVLSGLITSKPRDSDLKSLAITLAPALPG